MSTAQFIVSKNSTGEILRYGFVESTSVSLQAGAGETAYTVSSANILPSTHWVSGGVATAKVSLDTICSLTNAGGWLANGADTISYGTALPNPTLVTISCSNPRFTPVFDFNITDGTMTLTTTAAGNYTITLDAFPYIQKIITVTAT